MLNRTSYLHLHRPLKQSARNSKKRAFVGKKCYSSETLHEVSSRGSGHPQKMPHVSHLGKSRHLGFSRWRLLYEFSSYFSFQMTQAHNFSGKPYVFWDGRANANNKNIQTRDKRPIMIGQNRISSHIYDIFHFSLRQKQPLDQADI